MSSVWIVDLSSGEVQRETLWSLPIHTVAHLPGLTLHHYHLTVMLAFLGCHFEFLLGDDRNPLLFDHGQYLRAIRYYQPQTPTGT